MYSTAISTGVSGWAHLSFKADRFTASPRPTAMETDDVSAPDAENSQ
jgi:hypothetical protein